MVLSHSDADHLGAVDELCDSYKVKQILHRGRVRTTGTWGDADAAITLEKAAGCIAVSLKTDEFPPGATCRFGDAWLTVVCGFSDPQAGWGLKSDMTVAPHHGADNGPSRAFLQGSPLAA